MNEGTRDESRVAALRAEIAEQAIQAQALAIARYLLDHPEAVALARGWLTPEVEHWRSRSREEVIAEASRRRQQVLRWEAEVQEQHKGLWKTHQFQALEARYALGPARTGVFASAMGSLYDFLHQVGATVQLLDIHGAR